MSKNKWAPGPVAALLALMLLAGSAAPWFAAALALTAPAVAADAAGPLEQDSGPIAGGTAEAGDG